MTVAGWRYLVFSEPDGRYLGDAPLVGARITRALSAPGRLTGRIPDGAAVPNLPSWGVSIYAEDPGGTIRGGGFLPPRTIGAEADEVDCIGRSGYPAGMPWEGPRHALLEVDPLDVVRRVWAQLQSQPDGDARVVVDDTRSPVRVGTPEYWTARDGALTSQTPPDYWVDDKGNSVSPPDFWVDADGNRVAAPPDPANPPKGWKHYTPDNPPPGWEHYTRDHLPPGWRHVDAEPLLLEPWSTLDVGRVIDTLAADTPFDYLEHTAWNTAGTGLEHRLQLGYPRIGSRRTGPGAPRFELGVNVTGVPELAGEDADYASHVLGIGAGDGEAMIRTPGALPIPGRTGMRRVYVYRDKTARNRDALATAARRIGARLDGSARLHTLTVSAHEFAPLGSFELGDEVYVVGGYGRVQLDRWVRIVEYTVAPEATDTVELTVREV